MRRVDRPTEVAVRFAQNGKPQLLDFVWDGRRIAVSAAGRTWLDEAGRHVLVMVGGDRIFELLLRRSDLTWRVVGAPESPSDLVV